jgi:hypothetical protein
MMRFKFGNLREVLNAAGALRAVEGFSNRKAEHPAPGLHKKQTYKTCGKNKHKYRSKT